MSTILRLGNYCYFCISLLLPLQKRGRERNFNEWDLPGADRVPLASLTAVAVCKCVRDCSDLSPASLLDVYHQPTDKNTSKSGLWQLSAALSVRPPAVPARRWCSPLAGGNATLTKTKPAKKKNGVGGTAASKNLSFTSPWVKERKRYWGFPSFSSPLTKGCKIPVSSSESLPDIHYTNIEMCYLSKLSRGHYLSNLTC